MPLPTSLVGTSFTANEISTGSVAGSGPITFTEAKLLSDQKVLGTPIGPNATFTITSVGPADPTTGAQAISGTINNSPATFANGQSLTGTTVGVDGTDFIVTGSFAGSNGTFYVTNTPAQQPGVGNTATVAATSAGVAYTPACYCAGTLIRTEHGDVPVEQLAIGDRVVTLSGTLEAIRWIGVRSYHGRFLAGHDNLLPIRFRAGSLAYNVPSRDLLVSPKHAMFLDGKLIAAELLVNGSSIARETTARRVDYFHIELTHHNVIWAEGAASETFVDDESRGVFHNLQTYRELYPEAEHQTAEYCAPRITEGFELLAIRRQIDERARGFALAS